MAGHARLSASQTKQWIICSGSVPAIAAHPELQRDGSGYHAELGTAAHALGEECLTKNTHPIDYIGRIITIENDDAVLKPKKAKPPKNPTINWFEVDQDMVEAVDVYVDYINRRLDELYISRDELMIEVRVNPLPHRDDTGGTGDAVLDAWPTLLEAVDYKNGAGVLVPVESNDQLRSYILGAARLDDFSHERYRYTIVQPNHPSAPNGGISSEEMTRDELLAYAKDLDAAATRVDQATAALEEVKGDYTDPEWAKEYLSVGDDASHCTFCEIKRTCPAVTLKIEEQTQADFSEDPDDFDSLTDTGHLPIPTDPVALSIALKWLPIINKWAAEVKLEGQTYLESGETLEHWKLVRGRSNRTWATSIVTGQDKKGEDIVEDLTEEMLIEIMDKQFGVPKDKLIKTAPTRVTGPAAEKLIAKGLRAKFNKRLLYKPIGGLSVAPMSDKKEAIIINAGADFEDDDFD